jgi:hypothetical protein
VLEQVLADRYRLREEKNSMNEGPSATGARPFFILSWVGLAVDDLNNMLTTVLDEASHLLEELVEFERELQVILAYAESRWPDYSRHFPYMSYGFVMVAFSKVDLYGQYWLFAQGSQHKRMQSFLRAYLGYPEKESDIAIHLWRHNLVHTSEMRPLVDTRDGSQYRWLFHYRLDAEHMHLHRGSADQILSLGLFSLAGDLLEGLKKAIEKLPKLPEVVKNWPKITAKLGKFPRR